MALRVMGTRRIGERDGGDKSNPVVSILGDGGSISKLLPGYRERRQQLDLAAFVGKCFQDGTHGLGEAPTGVGKSLAYLVPAILSGHRTVVAVPTIALQDQLMTKDLPFLAREGVMPRPFTFALLKGRGNYVCRQKLATFSEEPSFESPEDAAVWPAFQDWYAESADGDLGKLSIPLPMAVKQSVTATSDECLGDSCPMVETCHAEAAKGRAAQAQIVVTNYALLMLDLQLRHETNGLATILPDDVRYLVLDECHQLREKAASAFEKKVTLGRLDFVARRIDNLAAKAQKVAATFTMERQAEESARAEEEGREARNVAADDLRDAWADRVRDVRHAWERYFAGIDVLLSEGKDGDALRLGDERDAAFDAAYALERLRIAMDQEGPTSHLDRVGIASWDKTYEMVAALLGDFLTVVTPRADDLYVRYAARDGDRIVLTFAPVDVAPFLRSRLWSASLAKEAQTPVTVVSVSATIQEGGSLGYYRETVGLDSCRELVVGSPFDYVRNSMLYVPADGLDSSAARKDPKAWAAYLSRLTDEYERLIRASGGRAFCLFTANKTMHHVHREITRRLGHEYLILKQGETNQTELVRRFKEDGKAVLFGVKSYWEGVDVQGEALSIAIISGMPFTPPTDPVFAARCEMIDRRYGRMASFRKISIPEATIALKQGHGRVIRTATDRGVIAILDSRLRGKGYGPGVIASLPPSPVTADLSDVARFFRAS